MNLHLGVWDFGLVAVVTSMATTVAYLHNPRYKGLLLMLPLPFSLALLAVGKPLDGTNVLGIADLSLVSLVVCILHAHFRWPIVLSIATGVTMYCLLGLFFNLWVPESDLAFWLAWIAAWLVSYLTRTLMPLREEAGYRAELAPYIKVPIIAAIVVVMVLVKNAMGAFVTTFPFVTTVALYEARFCLWTVAREVPRGAMGLLVMFAAIRLTQGSLGPAGSLLAGWAVYLPTMALLLCGHKFKGRLGRPLAPGARASAPSIAVAEPVAAQPPARD